jgi:hypothetical protein
MRAPRSRSVEVHHELTGASMRATPNSARPLEVLNGAHVAVIEQAERANRLITKHVTTR